MDGEKVEKISRALNASCLHDNGASHIKTVPSTSLRDYSNGSVDHTRNPVMAIPPLVHGFSAVAPAVNSGMGTIPGVQSYRYELGKSGQRYCLRTYLPMANISRVSHMCIYFQASQCYSFLLGCCFKRLPGPCDGNY